MPPPPTLGQKPTAAELAEYAKRHTRYLALNVGHVGGKRWRKGERPAPITTDDVKTRANHPWDPGRYPLRKCPTTKSKCPRTDFEKLSQKSKLGGARYRKCTGEHDPGFLSTDGTVGHRWAVASATLPYDVPKGTPDITQLDPSTPPPQRRKQAQASPYWAHYYGAEQLEVATLREMGAWQLVPRSSVTPGAKVLQPRWAYDHKKGSDGQILKAKSRFTAMGCMQTPGVDYADTYASVMTLKTFRTLLAMLVLDPTLDMEQWDCKAAYIHATLDQPVFVVQPPGHEDPEHPRWVLKLNKALYGLKQAGNAWQKHLRTILSEVGARTIAADPACYMLREGKGWIIIPTHVDDIFPLFNREGRKLRDKVWEHLAQRLQIVDLGQIEWALKTRIYHDRERGILKISQESYTLEVLTRFGMLGCKGAETPFMAKCVLPDPDGVTDAMVADAGKYPILELIGCLQWLAEISRPDIRAALHKAQVRQHRPNEKLWEHLKRILRYLKAYPHIGMVYKKPVNQNQTPILDAFKSAACTRALDQFVDIAFAPELGTNKGRSIIGGITRFYGNPVSWFTKRSRRTCSSTSEAECNGLTEIGHENAWHRDLHTLLGIYDVAEPTLTWEDNTAAVALSGSNTYHARSKHFGIEWYQTKERVERGEMEILYIPTREQLADVLTKTEFTAADFHRLRDGLMGGAELQEHFGRLSPPDPVQLTPQH